MALFHKNKQDGDNGSLGHGHRGVYRQKDRKWLLWAIAVTGITMLVEFVGSLLSGSLALFSDAAHMLTHFFALAISFVAILVSDKPASHQKTFGYYRAEILATVLNGLILLFITFYIIYEAYERFFNPKQIQTTIMLAVAVAGLVVNLISAYFLSKTDKKCLNLKSAFFHMISDTISSVAVILGAGAIYFTGITIIDPILAALISILIFIWSYNLLKDSIHILLESVPKGMSVLEIELVLKKEIPEIKGARDIHVWEITSGMYSLTANIVLSDMKISETKDILHRINHVLEDEFNIKHANIQFDV